MRLIRHIRKVLGIKYVVPASEARSGMPGHIHEGPFGDIVCHGCGVDEPLPPNMDPSWTVKAGKFLRTHAGHGPKLTTTAPPATSHNQPSAPGTR